MAFNVSSRIVPTSREKIAVETLYILHTDELGTKTKLSDLNNLFSTDIDSLQEEVQNIKTQEKSVITGTYNKTYGTFMNTSGENVELTSDKIYIDITSGSSYYYNGTSLIPEQGSSLGTWNEV